MALIQRMGRALVVVGALSVPGLALAEQPTETCDGDKMKEPTAEKSEAKQRTEDKASKRSDDKAEPKPEPKEPDQRS